MTYYRPAPENRQERLKRYMQLKDRGDHDNARRLLAYYDRLDKHYHRSKGSGKK